MIADHDQGPQTKLRTGESIISTRIWVFMGKRSQVSMAGTGEGTFTIF